jgi:ubiquinone/menaquinone biosynthesis C-methylase UbiE
MEGFPEPERILNKLDLRKDMLAAEFGCGSGVFAVALAKALADGRVYAIDVQQSVLSALRGKLDQEGLGNIEIIHSDLESPLGSTLASDSLDLVLMPNVLFQAPDKEKIISEAARVLKSNGQLLVLDWKKDSPLGPQPPGTRCSAEEIKAMAGSLGFEWQKDLDAGRFHWASVFAKKA